MNFEQWWLEVDSDLYHLSTVTEVRDFAEKAWLAAQEAERKKLDDELTAAYMMGYQDAKNDYGRNDGI